MFFRCLLLVLVCLQDFTVAQNANGPGQCCFSYQTHKIPVRFITAYQETWRRCQTPGVIFTLKSGSLIDPTSNKCLNPLSINNFTRVCADPVQDNMKSVDQSLFESSILSN
ncbi:hypothetical protein PHYPO_G00188450 [Pangasianodon hypophthalmus]|uniref:Chemokine interleukin-8-like domain-containing protein n=1 Tax=Pangasianodon hypophthalmus TaxID=310915 RepID=A0A5N5PIE2_PANHP|nr:hypothetical protein PHYPO_G00188450 [Pangasianodon hypophthalmus]